MADLIPPGVNPGDAEHAEHPENADHAEHAERERARKRLERKAKFRTDAVAYVLINLFLVGVWAVNGHGDFWPGWVMAGWGVLLALDAWDVYGRRPITDADIDAELRRTR